MKLNQRLSSINSKASVHGCSSQILCLLSLLTPEWMILNNDHTMYKGGCLYPLSLSKLKLSNLDLNIYLPTLNLINASYLFQTRAYGSRSDTSYKRLSFIKESLKTCATIPKHFRNFAFVFPADLSLDVLARLLSWRCSCIILLGLKIFMGSCPRAPTRSVHVFELLLLSPS